MKIYLATSGEYSDFGVVHAFARREDALAYQLGDDVLEFEVHVGPIEVRTWHSLTWVANMPDREGDSMCLPNPHISSERRDFDGYLKRAEHRWDGDPAPSDRPRLVVQGWELERVWKVYSEQRAQHIARQDLGIEGAT